MSKPEFAWAEAGRVLWKGDPISDEWAAKMKANSEKIAAGPAGLRATLNKRMAVELTEAIRQAELQRAEERQRNRSINQGRTAA